MLNEASPRGLTRVILFSAIIHVVILAVLVGLGQRRRTSHKPLEAVLVTKLVRLGKERPKDYLPRLESAPALAPEPVSTRPAPREQEAAPPPSPTRVSAESRLKEMTQVSRALERLRGKTAEVPEGHESGVKDGEAKDLASAVAGNLYATEIYRCLKDNYAIFGVNPSAVRDLSVLVLLYIDASGTFTSHRLLRKSGLSAFDAAVERAIKTCGKVSPPPRELRDQVRDGLEVEFQL